MFKNCRANNEMKLINFLSVFLVNNYTINEIEQTIV